jgi:hypothetical protein
MLGAILSGASLLGKLFGGAGKGAAAERGNQNDLISRDNMTRASLYGTQQGALSNAQALQERSTMDRARMGVSAPQQRMLQALLGSMVQNAQGAQFSGLPAGVTVPKMSGGMNPSSLINALQRAGGGAQQKQALLAALTGSDTPAATNYVGTGVMPQPQMQGYKQPGKGESLLSMLGLVGSVAGGLQGMGVGQQKPPVNYNVGGY